MSEEVVQNNEEVEEVISFENLVLLAIGLTIGYLLAMIGAWIISSSVGFLKFNLGTADDLRNFIRYDRGAFLTSLIVIGSIVFIATRRKGKEFIELEVTEAVQKATWKRTVSSDETSSTLLCW